MIDDVDCDSGGDNSIEAMVFKDAVVVTLESNTVIATLVWQTLDNFLGGVAALHWVDKRDI